MGRQRRQLDTIGARGHVRVGFCRVVCLRWLSPGDQDKLHQQLVNLAREYDRNLGEGPIAIYADYLKTIIVRQ